MMLHSTAETFSWRRRASVMTFVLLALLPLALSACGGNSGSSNVTLKMIIWTNPAIDDAVKQINDEFHQQNPNITIDMTTVSVDTYQAQLFSNRLAANDADIVATQSLVPVPQSWTPSAQPNIWVQAAASGQLLDLTGQSFLNNFFPSAIQNAGTYNGKVYSVTGGLVSYTGMFYNKDIFAKYNLQPPTTFQQMVTLCDALKAKGVTPITTGGKELWPLDLLTQGAIASAFPDQNAQLKALWTGSEKFTDPSYVDIITRSQKIMSYLEPNFTGEDTATATGRFANGQAAMLLSGTWDAANILMANPSANIGYFPDPISDNASANNFLAGKYDLGYAIAAGTKHKAEALKWMSFWADPQHYAKYVQGTGNVPVQQVSGASPFLQSIQPYLNNFRLAWDQVAIDRKNPGKYVATVEFHLEFLDPAGPIKTPQDLAQQTQADWDAAANS